MNSIYERRYVGKDSSQLEEEFDLDYYIETKHKLFGNNPSHKLFVECFLNFFEDNQYVVLKMDEEVVIKADTSTSRDYLKENLILMEEDRGSFFINREGISWAFLNKDYLVIILNQILMISTKKENLDNVEKSLKKFNLEYYKPTKIN